MSNTGPRRAWPVVLTTLLVFTGCGAGRRARTATRPPSPATTVASRAGPQTDGQVFSSQFGPTQVATVMRHGRLIDVITLAMPTDRPRSLYISDQAGPLLRREALRAQSAKIHVISGATYTSEAYASSLQSALDRAGVR